jgi:hypothetical protein
MNSNRQEAFQEWKQERHTKQITPFLTPSQFDEVKQFAKANKVSVSEVVRASLSLFLSTYSVNNGEKYVADRQSKPKAPKRKRSKKTKEQVSA